MPDLNVCDQTLYLLDFHVVGEHSFRVESNLLQQKAVGDLDFAFKGAQWHDVFQHS